MIDRRRFLHVAAASMALVAASPVVPGIRFAAADSAPDVADFAHEMWRRVADEHGLDPMLLYAISVHESGRAEADAPLRPWPFAINTPRGPVYATDEGHARRVLAAWRNDRRLDVGLMQVNLGYHRERVEQPAHLVEPETNLRVAAAILAEAIAACGGDVWAGVGRYHSADPKRAQRYVAAVAETFRRVSHEHGTAMMASVPFDRRR